MATCPQGHISSDEEFCDVCGREIRAAHVHATTVSTVSTGSGRHAAADTLTAEPGLPATGTACAVCDAPLGGRFCEACGHDSLVAPAAPPVRDSEPPPALPVDRMPESVTWTATVTANRSYFDAVMAVEAPDAAGIRFPPYCPDRHFPLAGKEISIGRRSRSRGIHPDIDLLGPPEDPGVSHLHALLIAQDGGWSVVDLDSANGTFVNEDVTPLEPNVPRPLVNGDRVYIGAWTRILFRRT